MAKLSEKTAATVLVGTDELPINQDTTTTPVSKKSALTLIRDWILANAANGSAAAPSISFAGDPDTGFYSVASNNIGVSTGAAERFRFSSSGHFNAIGGLLIGGTTASPHIQVLADAAHQLAIRGLGGNSTTAQSLAVYTTYTDASNYERLRIYGTAASAFTIASEAAGTGTVRNIRLANKLEIGAANQWIDTPATNILELGAAGSMVIRITANNLKFHAWVDGDQVINMHPQAGVTNRNSSSIRIDAANGTGTGAIGAFKIRTAPAGSSGLLNHVLENSLNLRTVTAGEPILSLGPDVTSDTPAIKRSGTKLQARLADDSAYATFQGKLQTDANAVSESITPTHTLTIYDAAGTAYKVAVQAA